MLRPALLLQLVVAASSVTPPAATIRRSVPTSATLPTAYRPLLMTRAPQIDGRDDDPVWRTVPVISDFRQYDPTEDGAPSLRTEARFGYDARNLAARDFD